jgi:signal transduction histidine kinase
VTSGYNINVRASSGDGGSFQAVDTQQVFRLLVLYRWLSLIPALLALPAAVPRSYSLAALAAAAAANLLITLFPGQVNGLVRRRPALLAVDILLCAGLAALTGGWSTPYYLHALSPLLAAAFFFQWRGALAAAAGMALAFTLAGLPHGPIVVHTWAAQATGFFLIAGTFGFATTLLARLDASHADLDRAHRDLAVIHNLMLYLQTASDVAEVQEHVLQAVTGELGFERAAIALVEDDGPVITDWLAGCAASPGTSGGAGVSRHPARLPLAPDSGPIARCLLSGQAEMAVPAPLTNDAGLNAFLGPAPCHIFPMVLREHPVGVLLVATPVGTAGLEPRMGSLRSIASQAAVALGTTLLCIDRAQRLAVQDERLRFAREVHDTVAQSLFGLSYALDACARLLPEQPEQVKAELTGLQRQAEDARRTLRQLIVDTWPSGLTAARFKADLQRYAAEVCRAPGLELSLSIGGGFDPLPAGIRRSLYRVAQEALANVVRHARATRAEVCLEVAESQATLTVRDDGCGFDPAGALDGAAGPERFGLHGMRERIADLGGTLEIHSQPGAGTTLLVRLPIPP